MKHFNIPLLINILLTTSGAFHIRAQDIISGSADLVFLNAMVHTVSKSLPHAQAVAVVGDRIAAVGTNDEVEAWISPQTRVIDAEGMTITPGFIESHGYLMGLVLKEKYLDLSKAGTYDELIRMVADAFRKAKWLTQDKSRREKIALSTLDNSWPGPGGEAPEAYAW